MKKPNPIDFNIDFSEDLFPTHEEREELFEYIYALEKYVEYLENNSQSK